MRRRQAPDSALAAAALHGRSPATVQVVDDDALPAFTLQAIRLDGDVTVRGSALAPLRPRPR